MYLLFGGEARVRVNSNAYGALYAKNRADTARIRLGEVLGCLSIESSRNETPPSELLSNLVVFGVSAEISLDPTD